MSTGEERISVTGLLQVKLGMFLEISFNLLNFYFRSSFLKLPKTERQEKLLKEFGFACDCVACMENYPTSEYLKCKDPKLFLLAKKVNEENFQRDQNGRAIKRYREVCECIEQKNEDFPSIELCVLQKYFAKFLIFKAQPSVLFP